MHTITLPQALNGMRDGTIGRWLKSEGDPVAAGEVVVEVQTERAVVQVQVDQAGTLAEILAPVGKTVAVGDALARISVTAEGGAAAAPPAGAAATAAAIPIVMPKAGNTMEEGTIVAWRVKVGDTINVGDILFEVETDKAVVEVEATDAGRLARIVAADGDTVAVLDPVGYLADSDAEVDAYVAQQAHTSAAPVRAAEAIPAPGAARAAEVPSEAPIPGARRRISPAARKLATERGIEPSTLPAGSGPGGRILTTDLPAEAPVAAEGSARRTMSPMRKAIARNLSASKQTIPHFYIEVTVDAAPMMALYRQQKAEYPCSVNDVVVAACARAVGEFRAFRSRLEGDTLVESGAANIGIAVALDDGLVVPVLLGADHLSLRELAAETRRLVEAARGGRVDGLGQGVLTITNLGMYGVERFSAIINPPEAAILAVGAARDAVVVRDGEILAGRVMTLTLSCDHRVIDGAVAAQFLARLKEILEAPEALLK